MLIKNRICIRKEKKYAKINYRADFAGGGGNSSPLGEGFAPDELQYNASLREAQETSHAKYLIRRDNLSQNGNKIAFTLAEVLITLGIIGVVAALTMPALVAKYKVSVLRNQGRKVYSVLNTAYQKTLYDYGISNYTYNPGDESVEFTKSFLANLNVVERYENVPLISNGVIPQYEPLSTVLNNMSDYTRNAIITGNNLDPTKTDPAAFMLASFNGYDNPSNWKYAYYLNDGTLIIIYPYTDGISIANFLVDLNGRKGPNKWGQDLHPFKTTSNPRFIIMPFEDNDGIRLKNYLSGVE